MISQIRYQQQYQQLQNGLVRGAGTISTYINRDAITGQRNIKTADGGVGTAQYISNSVPNSVFAVSLAGTIGLAGYVNQKPH